MKLNQEIIDFHEEEEKKNSCYLTAVQYSSYILQPPYHVLVFSPSTSGIGHQIRISEESSKLDIGNYKERYFEVIEKNNSDKKRAIDLRDELMSSKSVGDLIKLGWSVNINPSFGMNQIFI